MSWLRILDGGFAPPVDTAPRTPAPSLPRKPRTVLNPNPRPQIRRLNAGQRLFLAAPGLTTTCRKAATIGSPTAKCRRLVAWAVNQSDHIYGGLSNPHRQNHSAGQAEWIRDHTRRAIESLRVVQEYAAPYPNHARHVQRAIETCENIVRTCDTYLRFTDPGPYDQSRFSAWLSHTLEKKSDQESC